MKFFQALRPTTRFSIRHNDFNLFSVFLPAEKIWALKSDANQTENDYDIKKLLRGEQNKEEEKKIPHKQ